MGKEGAGGGGTSARSASDIFCLLFLYLILLGGFYCSLLLLSFVWFVVGVFVVLGDGGENCCGGIDYLVSLTVPARRAVMAVRLHVTA